MHASLPLLCHGRNEIHQDVRHGRHLTTWLIQSGAVFKHMVNSMILRVHAVFISIDVYVFLQWAVAHSEKQHV